MSNDYTSNPIIFNFDSLNEEIVFCIFLVITIILLPFMISKTKQSINRILDPKVNNSYCVVSVHILYISRIGLIIILVCNVVLAIGFVLKTESKFFILIIRSFSTIPVICVKVNLYL